MDKRSTNMLTGPLFPSIIRYTIPIILTSVLQLLFNAADLVVVGRFCGSISVAAVGATGALTNLIVNLFIGLSVGAGVTTAHGLGSREDEVVHNTVHTAIPLALVGSVILTVVGVTFSPTFLEMMGTPENVRALSAIYMRIYFGGVVFVLLYNFCAAILRAAGDTRSPLIYLSFAGVLNVVLNVIFVTVLHMNVAGVALATILSQAVSAMLVLRALMHRTDACRLDLKELRFHGKQLKKILQIGLPAGVQGCLFSISNVLIQSSVNSFGDVFMSGNAAASNIDGFIYVSLNAFHQTAVNFIGQNIGAGQYKRVSQTLKICLGCTAVLGLVLGFASYFFGPALLGIYITDSAEAIGYGMIRLAFIGLPYFVCGLMDVANGALRGIGESVGPMCISVIGICAFRVFWVSTVFQIPLMHTPEGLYLSYPVSWIITFCCQIVWFTFAYRRYVRRADALRSKIEQR